jgi:methyl-accepting chemotaxis protein
VVLRVRCVAGRLEAAAGRVARGGYDCAFHADARCELGRAEAALSDMYARLKRELSFARGVLAGIQAPFVVVDTEERLVMTNQGLIEILEQSGRPEDHYGQNVAHFFYGDASRRTVLRDSLENGVTTAREVELTGRKGGKRLIHIHASPLYDLDGALMGALCIYQDRTALRAREAELEGRTRASPRPRAPRRRFRARWPPPRAPWRARCARPALRPTGRQPAPRTPPRPWNR